MSSSTYGVYGYNSILYTAYSACIRPYITSSTVVLEIGPGRGAWSKTFLHRDCRKLYAVDVADPAHTHFRDYVGIDSRAEYLVVDDLLLAEVPDYSIDFFFSFGVFCHLKPEMCEEYLLAILRKIKHGSRGFLMIADFDKYEQCRGTRSFFRGTVPRRAKKEDLVSGEAWLLARVALLLGPKMDIYLSVTFLEIKREEFVDP